MKNILILIAILLFGMTNVSAQAYEVYAEWEYESPNYCLSQLTNEYEFKITLQIYDNANPGWVANVTNTEDWDETETTFSATQTGVENWCDNALNTPSLRTSVTVKMVHKTTGAEYCSAGDDDIFTCSQFSNGIYFVDIKFY